MTTATIEAGTLTASLTERTVTGLLLPYGEVGNTNLGKFSIDPGAVKIPRDASVVTANTDHLREQPVGRATQLADTDAGIVATFTIADTEEGDALLVEIEDGSRSNLSAEVKGIVLRNGKAVSGQLFGAAFVAKGAFPSATLMAADVGELPDDATESEGAIVFEPIDGDIAVTATQLPETVTVTVEDNSTTFTPETEPESEESEVTTATIPNTLTAAASAAPDRTSVSEVINALALFSRNGDRTLIDAVAEKPQGEDMLFAALNDVKLTTSGSVGVNIQQPQWLGELWSGRSYERRIIPLIGHGDLTSFKVSGFKWGTTPTMAAWAGDKANVPSNTPTTVPYTEVAKRYAGGHDIAREFRDFDVPEFWDAYFKAMTDSYAKLTDDDALAALIAGATAVTAGVVPSGVNAGLVSIVDGALAVLPTGTPNFAVVAPDIYRSILLTRDTDQLAFLNMALGLEEGTLTSFRVVPHTGIAAGKALVGVSAAATEFELPGSPIRTEALDQIKGGIDEALFGYAATIINKPEGLALVTPAS